MPSFSQLTPCTHTKYNPYFSNSLHIVESVPDLYRLLSFHAPNLMSLFHCLGRSKGSVQVRGSCIPFVTRPVLRWGVVSTSSNRQAGRPPVVGCPRLLIQYIRCYHPYRRPFLHPQPEDVPCCGDRDPLIISWLIMCVRITVLSFKHRNM